MTPLKSIIDIPIHRISTENLKKFCRLYKVNNFMRENISRATRPILCNAICQAKESLWKLVVVFGAGTCFV